MATTPAAPESARTTGPVTDADGPPPSAPSGRARSAWERLPVVARTAIFALAFAVIGILIANGISRYRDFQLAEIAAYLVAVAGLTVLTGLNGQISLGHGALMAVGAYCAAVLLLHAHLPLVVVLLLSALAGGVAGVLVGAVAARLRGPYLAGATLALAVGLPEIPKNYKYFGRDEGLTINPPLPPGWLGANAPIERWGAYICIIGAAVTLFLLANLSRGRVGRNFRAVRDDEIAASLAGISVPRTQILAFTVSAACAGLAGGLLALVTPTVGPGGFSLALSIQLLVAIVIGGMGNLPGAVLGSIVLVYLPSWATSISNGVGLSKQIGANLALAIFGGMLIVVMLAFPGGIAAAVRRTWWALTSRRRPATTIPAGP